MKRIHIINAIGWLCVMLAVICGLGVYISIGIVGETLKIMPGIIYIVLFGIATVVFGKLGTALVLM